MAKQITTLALLFLFISLAYTDPTATPTASPTITPIPTPSPTSIPSATPVPTPTASSTPILTPTPTPSPPALFNDSCVNSILHVNKHSSNLIASSGHGTWGYSYIVNGLTDPGSWSACVDSYWLDSPTVYCWLTSTQSRNFTKFQKEQQHYWIGACLPQNCSSTTEVSRSLDSVLKDVYGLPPEMDDGFTIDCKQADTNLGGGAITMIVFLSLLGVLVFLGTVVDIQLEYKILPKIEWAQITIEEETREGLDIKFPSKETESMYENFNNRSVLADYGDYDITNSDSQLTTPLVDNATIQDDDRDERMSTAEVLRMYTAPERKERHNVFVQCFLAWSILTNARSLFSSRTDKNLAAINGLKTLAMFGLIMGQTFGLMFKELALNNITIMFNLVKTFRWQFLVSAQYSYDTFFFCSGFLIAYVFIRELKQNKIKWYSVPYLYFHRFWRITPTLWLSIFIWWQIVPHCGNSPYWMYFQDYVTKQCTKGWWTTMLYANNFFPSDYQCEGWTWYVDVEMQIFLFFPILLVLFYLNKWVGWFMSAVLIFLNVCACVFFAWFYNLHAYDWLDLISGKSSSFVPPTDDDSFYHLFWIRPYTRFGVYILGSCAAFVVLHFGHRIHIHAITRGFMYTFSLLVIFILCFVSWSAANYSWNQPENVVFLSLNSLSFGIALLFIIVPCIVGYGGIIRIFLAHRFWTPFARLNYSCYIFHVMIITAVYVSWPTNYSYTFVSAVYFLVTNVLLSYAFAFVNYLLWERPLMNIERAFVKAFRLRQERLNKSGASNIDIDLGAGLGE